MTERVTLRFRGLMLEKFIQRALKDGVTFEAVRRLGRREARLTTDAQGARSLMALAERFHLDVAEVSRGGPGAVMRRLRRRWTLPMALLAMGVLTMMFLSRLWVIDVRRLDEADDSAPIYAALLELGVTPGTPMDKIDSKALSLRLQSAVPEFAYIGARTQGVRLLIEATRALPAPDVYDPEAARDLVASCDALLVSLDVMAGTAAVEPGQVVKKGQVLIRGEERDGRETTRGVCALGSAVGRAWVSAQAEAPLVSQTLEDTGRISYDRTLRYPGGSISLRTTGGYLMERTQARRLPVGGLLLPIYIEEIAHIEQARTQKQADPGRLKGEITKIALQQALSSLPQGIHPVDKWIDYSMIEGENMRARAVVEYRLNIAVSREALNAQHDGGT